MSNGLAVSVEDYCGLAVQAPKACYAAGTNTAAQAMQQLPFFMAMFVTLQSVA